MGERLDKFRKDASILQDKIDRYRKTFDAFSDLFPEELEIPEGRSHAVLGKTTLPGPPPYFQQIEVAVIVRKFAPSSDLQINLGIEIGPNNVASLEQFDLPHPSKTKESDLDKINNDDLLGEIICKIEMPSEEQKRAFTPVD
jgi:hypothetical protein